MTAEKEVEIPKDLREEFEQWRLEIFEKYTVYGHGTSDVNAALNGRGHFILDDKLKQKYTLSQLKLI
eukprot:CAMPEP_0201582428 /NCGR_PEP_ID=MMETSP0190_2-20130828/85015_1 /ASSEMBLY_ACC=CAM_ASM_000263 /TAXON_ID=37353 /ORGANISM="Rosalina sp." /LENGTH=66 /DNA_ID=CAMNT_0048022297 /DNA_START=50 /DNA_END=247 /DNA_ORIENTATION=+